MSAPKMWYAVVDKDGALTMCDDDNECQHHARWQNQNKHAAIFAPHRAVTLVEWQPWMDVPQVVRDAIADAVMRERQVMNDLRHRTDVREIAARNAMALMEWLVNSAALPPITTEESDAK